MFSHCETRYLVVSMEGVNEQMDVLTVVTFYTCTVFDYRPDFSQYLDKLN
jgi:hypothetical protein